MGAAVIGLAVALTACPAQGERPWGTVTDTDRQRYAELRDDPVFDGLEVHGKPGEYRTPRVGRSEIDADLPRLAEPAEMHKRDLELLERAQRAGWTLYLARCTATRWESWWYRLTEDGVSLLLQVRSERDDEGGSLHVRALAPQVDEPKNLLPERPPAVQQPCMRAATPPASTVVQGVDVVFRSSGEAGRRPAGRTR